MTSHAYEQSARVSRTLRLSATLVLAALAVVALFFVLRLPSVAGPESISVGMVTDTGGLSGNPFNWLAYQGLMRAEGELGVAGTVYTSTAPADFEPNLNQCVGDGNDLCLSIGWGSSVAVQAVAESSPATDFAIVDAEFATYTNNLRGIIFDTEQVGYLAGTLAGLMSESDVVGSVGGMEIPPVTAFVEPYRIGAQCSNPSVTVVVTYTGDFVDPEVGAIAAQAMIAQGADVIFGVGGNMGNGAVLTATQSGAWGIGVDVDAYYTLYMSGTVPGSDKLLSSAVKRVDNAVYGTIADVISGTFTSGTYLSDLSTGGIGLAPFHEADAAVSDSVRGALSRVESGLINKIIDPYGPCPSYRYLPAVVKQ
jgi:basic membrane protein A